MKKKEEDLEEEGILRLKRDIRNWGIKKEYWKDVKEKEKREWKKNK